MNQETRCYAISGEPHHLDQLEELLSRAEQACEQEVCQLLGLLVMQGSKISVKQLARWQGKEVSGESLKGDMCESAAFRMTILGGEEYQCQIAS